MKANNGSGNIPERDEWKTPEKLFYKLFRQYQFNYDCCALEKNTKCLDWSNDFLSINTLKANVVVWMNPPFSKAKDMFIHFFKVVKKGVAIYRCDNFETRVWQEIIFLNSDWIFIPNQRIVYEGMNGSGSRFPSALIGVGVDIPKYIDGRCLSIIE
jgi:hypothetical protein